MENVVNKIVDIAKDNRSFLQKLRSLMIQNKDYELASELRKIELLSFPEQKLTDKQYKEAQLFETACRMVDIKVSDKVAYKLLEAAKGVLSEDKEFSIKDASRIICDADSIFGVD